jgi:glucoamylase
MLSEQVWDAPDIPNKELLFGRPSGSAMPLVWAHAEYVKLRRSLREGRVFDTPPQTIQRYQVRKIGSPYAIWRFNHKCRTIMRGKTLRLEVLAPATVHWSDDGWRTMHDTPTKDSGVGVHCADLLIKHISVGGTVKFTFYWVDAGKWENTDFAVTIAEA